MFVQDIVSPNVNIGVEIPKEEANNFKTMCTVFAFDKSSRYIVTESISKLSQLPEPKHHLKFDEITVKAIIEEKPKPKQNAEILDLIEKKIVDMWSFSESRQNIEAEIISTITKYIHSFDASLGIIKIGSSQYGVKESTTNVNLLINTCKSI